MTVTHGSHSNSVTMSAQTQPGTAIDAPLPKWFLIQLKLCPCSPYSMINHLGFGLENLQPNPGCWLTITYSGHLTFAEKKRNLTNYPRHSRTSHVRVNFQVADWKEVFMLFDRDEDGVLSFQELQVVMKSMGERPSGKQTKDGCFRRKKY